MGNFLGRNLSVPLRNALVVALGILSFTPANAYPDRPVKVIVTFAAGGAVDTMARVVGQSLSEQLGQQFVIENRPGASGHTGALYVSRSAADGYTLLFAASSTIAVSPHMMKLNYDPLVDLTPIGLAAITSNVVVVPVSSPAKTLTEFIDYARKNPGSLVYASTGVATNTHLGAEMLALKADIRMRHLPYSNAQYVQDLLEGRVHMHVANLPPVLPLIQDGRLRALAVTSNERLRELPSVPAVSEVLPGYSVKGWGMLMGPKETPKQIINQLNKAMKLALQSESVIKAFELQSYVPAPLSPEESLTFMKQEHDLWADVARAVSASPAP